MGSGWLDWQDDDVITESSIQAYLQDQVVMVFADTDAADIAIGGAKAEGMMVYSTDEEALYVSINGTTGSANWKEAAGGTTLYFGGVGSTNYIQLDDAGNYYSIYSDDTEFVRMDADTGVSFLPTKLRLGSISGSEYFFWSAAGTNLETADGLGVYVSGATVMTWVHDSASGNRGFTMGESNDGIFYEAASEQMEFHVSNGTHGTPTIRFKSGGIHLQSGSAANPAVNFGLETGADDYGIYYNSGAGGLVSTSISGTEVLRVGSTGTIPVVSPTPASGTSWVVGTFGELRKASSSMRYKRATGGEQIPLEAVDALADAVIAYRYIEDERLGVDREFVSLIAEPAADVDGRLVFWSDDPETGEPRPEDISDRTLTGLLIRSVADLRKRIADAGIA